MRRASKSYEIKGLAVRGGTANLLLLPLPMALSAGDDGVHSKTRERMYLVRMFQTENVAVVA
jgi:hypothetical protein